MPSCTEQSGQGVTMLQFNCFICSKSKRKTGPCGNRVCKSFRALTGLQTGLQGDNALSVGSQPSSGKNISNSCCHQHIFLPPHGWAGRLHWKPELPGNHSALSKASESVALPELLVLVCVWCLGLDHQQLGALFKLKWINSETGAL